MNRILFPLVVFFLFSLSLAFMPGLVHAEVEWTTTKKMNLKAAPLDSAPSADGQRLFILTRGEILIYSIPQYKVMNRIPVDKSFDKLTISPKSNSLIITSSTKKTLEIIQLEFIQNIDISGLPVKGPEGAPVTIAVFSDYQWPYCARLEPLLQQVLDKYPKDVKLVTKHFPLQNHKFARQAAIAALAADKQGKYWEYHDKIFENFKGLNDTKIQEIAKEVGLDMKQFNKDLKDRSIQTLINRDLNNGRQAGVRGTPTIFINGKRLQKRNLQGFQQIIEAELKKTR